MQLCDAKSDECTVHRSRILAQLVSLSASRKACESAQVFCVLLIEKILLQDMLSRVVRMGIESVHSYSVVYFSELGLRCDVYRGALFMEVIRSRYPKPAK